MREDVYAADARKAAAVDAAVIIGDAERQASAGVEAAHKQQAHARPEGSRRPRSACASSSPGCVRSLPASKSRPLRAGIREER